MDRRDFVRSGLVAGAAGMTGVRPAAAATDEPRRHYELRNYELRSDLNPGRLRNYLRDVALPAYSRAGANIVGVFTVDTGFISGSVLALTEYASLGDIDSVATKLAGDSAYSDARRTWETADDVPYVRYQSQLMRAFTGHPRVEVPASLLAAPRMFELRTYEARSEAALEKKIAMFNEVEITLFRQIGMTPVFFGENIFGTRLPSLTYMLTFDDMAARTKAWATFSAHPEWLRIQKLPQYQANGAVTATNVAYLRPVNFSTLR